MPRLRRPPEHQVLAYPGRDLAVTAVVVALTVVLFVVVAQREALPEVQRLDDAWLQWMVEHRAGPWTALALLLNVLGLVWVTLPVRIALAGYLAVLRSWWHFSAFVAAIAASELLIGLVKAAFDRARPPDPLVGTTGASFPSGHAVAASATVIAAVIALVPPGRARAVWGAAAAAFSCFMALSRTYLGAHWLTDALGGVLLGTSCALVAAVVVGALQRWRTNPAGRLVPSADVQQRGSGP